MILNSSQNKEYYSTLKIMYPDPGFTIIPAEYFDTILRGEKEVEYSKNCSNENGYIFSITEIYTYEDTIKYVFPSLSDLVYYIQNYFIKQYEISYERDNDNEDEFYNYVLSDKSLKIVGLIDTIIGKSDSEDELFRSLEDQVMNQYYPNGYSIYSIQDYLEEHFEDEPVEETTLKGIFWKENGKRKDRLVWFDRLTNHRIKYGSIRNIKEMLL